MSLNAAAVRVAVTGELSSAPTGTARPTSSVVALNAAYTGLGYVSEDGVTQSLNDTIENIKAWQNAAIVRASATETVATFQCTLIENKGKVAELYYKIPGGVTATGAGSWKLNVTANNADQRQFVFDVLDGTKHYRIDIGAGEVTERGDITYANGEPIGYDVTLTCYPDSSNVLYTVWTDDTNWGYS